MGSLQKSVFRKWMCCAGACFPENIFIREPRSLRDRELFCIGFSPSIQTKKQNERGTGGKQFSSVPQAGGWTADRHFSGRIGNREGYGKWIPDFQYEVVRIHDYSDEELLKRGDEMSLIMMINKIQDASDLDGFLKMPGWELDKIVQDSPMHVIDVMAKVVESLCFKIDASEEERTECVFRYTFSLVTAFIHEYKEVSANNYCDFMADFIVFPDFCLNILQEPLRKPCNQKEIAAVIFRQFLSC